MRPLADEIRPNSISDVVGQKHLLSESSLLRRLIDNHSEANMIFYGPSGTGKTTVANIIATNSHKTIYHLNATTASISDIKAIIDDLDTIVTQNGVLLYLDEIQYFNKKQQQTLLSYLENGKISLIASTTENPYFYIYNALLSRCSIFEFKALSFEDIEDAIKRALHIIQSKCPISLEWDDDLSKVIARTSGGDVRKAINAVDLLYQASKPIGGKVFLKSSDISQLLHNGNIRYDKDGDEHYDLLSALQKSIRGSDPDAAVYYLARLLSAGDLISPCRRLLVIASEDVGLAYPLACTITKSCVDSAIQLGLPEAQIPLSEAAILLATAPKSNSACIAIEKAMSDISKGFVGTIPRHLQNVHADSSGIDNVPHYLYPHNFNNHYVKQQYLPDELASNKYYTYGDNKVELSAKHYWDDIKKD